MKVFRVTAKPNSPKTRIVSQTDEELVVEVAAPAENNKANIELIKFLRKKFCKNVRIMRGLTGKKKLIAIS